MNALHPRVQALWTVRVLAIAAALGAAGYVADRFVTVGAWAGPAVAVATLALGVGHVLARYRLWGYEVQADALYLERGVLTRVETSVPYVRIQHVDTRRGPLARALGLGHVVVYTAGNRGADVTVPGLTVEGARGLRDRLRDLATESEPTDAV